MKGEMPLVDVKNLSSRKLYELCATTAVGPAELVACIEELQSRQHYLTQLAQLSEVSRFHTPQRAQRH